MKLSSDSVAGVVARFLKTRGVDRVFALCGGHIMPLWMHIDAQGIGIVYIFTTYAVAIAYCNESAA